MSYISREASSYYLLKDKYDKGLFKRRSDLIGSQVYEYHTALKVLTNLGFLKKYNGEYCLKDLSDIELMLFVNEFQKEIIIKNDNKKEVRKRKEKLKVSPFEEQEVSPFEEQEESTIEEQEENDFDTHFNINRISLFDVKLNISDYSDEQILAELKKRGYEGELFILVKQKVKI